MKVTTLDDQVAKMRELTEALRPHTDLWKTNLGDHVMLNHERLAAYMAGAAIVGDVLQIMAAWLTILTSEGMELVDGFAPRTVVDGDRPSS